MLWRINALVVLLWTANHCAGCGSLPYYAKERGVEQGKLQFSELLTWRLCCFVCTRSSEGLCDVTTDGYYSM